MKKTIFIFLFFIFILNPVLALELGETNSRGVILRLESSTGSSSANSTCTGEHWTNTGDQYGLSGTKGGTLIFADISDTDSINVFNRLLQDSSGFQKVDWENSYLYSDNKISVDWVSKYLIDSNEASSIWWNDRILVDTLSNTVLDWEHYKAFDNLGYDSIDWSYRNLTGDWKLNNQNICLSNGTNCLTSSGSMNYTNLALTNKSNTFILSNSFNGILTSTDSNNDMNIINHSIMLDPTKNRMGFNTMTPNNTYHFIRNAVTNGSYGYSTTNTFLVEDTEGSLMFLGADTGNFGATIFLSNVNTTGSIKSWGLLSKATSSNNRFAISYGTTNNVNDYGGTAEKLQIETDGNITIPTGTLTINKVSSDANLLNIKNPSSGYKGGAIVFWNDIGSTALYNSFRIHSNFSLGGYTGTQARFQLATGSDTWEDIIVLKRNNPRVGINTQNPIKTLDVNGDVRISGTQPTFTLQDTNAGETRPAFEMLNNSLMNFAGDGTMDSYNKVTFSFFGNFTANRTSHASFKIFGNASGTWGNYLEFTHSGSGGNGILSTDTGNITLSPNSMTTTVNGDLSVSGNLSVKVPYAMFSDNTTQIIGVASTAQIVNFSTTEDNYLITLTGKQNISVQKRGDYYIDVSAIFSTDLPNKHVEFWLQKANSSGTFVNVPRSNTKMELPSSSVEIPLAVSFIIDLETTDKIRFMMASDDAGSSLLYTTNTSYSPEIPSIIINMYKISDIT